MRCWNPSGKPQISLGPGLKIQNGVGRGRTKDFQLKDKLGKERINYSMDLDSNSFL